ncbi:MAG: hypothetical protein J6Y91_06665 [Alphaproteobacteria bacterium]|nr:hypothetical protein [Alphaproteobacteria bacterium]
MKKINVLVTVLLLCGCRNIGFAQSEYAAKLQPWLGQSADALFAQWGTPATTQQIDDNTFLVTYEQSESQPVDNNLQPYESELSYDAMAVPNYGLPTPPPLFYCQTSFTIQNNIITDYSFNGDDCF